MQAHFASIATRYDELRTASQLGTPHDERLVELGDLSGRRVLDLGCGTGRLLAVLTDLHDVDGVGVDASAEMVDVARGRKLDRATFLVAPAEALPLADGSCERAVTTFAVHHFDRPRAFSEVRRVVGPRGRFVISTTDPDAFDRFWMAPLFPSYAAVERARFPDGATLRAELEAVGFENPVVERFELERVFSRESALEKLRSRHASTFELIGDDEYAEGIERAERELADPVEYLLELLLVRADAA